jgi:dTDP-4-dehydrorhamnose reductase
LILSVIGQTAAASGSGGNSNRQEYRNEYDGNDIYPIVQESKMNILILGAGGMLGHQLCLKLKRFGQVYAVFRKPASLYERYGMVAPDNAFGSLDLTDLPTLTQVLVSVRPNVVVNAVGIVKQRKDAKAAIPSITVNALLPHVLAERCREIDARLIHFSTDCVFSGNRGAYTESDNPDPIDLYGRSKLLGEIERKGCLTLRTSIIGWELENRAGLLEWFAAQRGRDIDGYRNAIYTGLTTPAMAELVARLILEQPELSGLYHVASSRINKFDLLVNLAEQLEWRDIRIHPQDQFKCDRSLIGSRFETLTGWHPASWEAMLAGLAAEWPNYEKWRKQIQ